MAQLQARGRYTLILELIVIFVVEDLNVTVKCRTIKVLLLYFHLNIFYCSKRQKDKTQAEQLRQSSPITYITKYTIDLFDRIVSHDHYILYPFLLIDFFTWFQ